RGAGTRRAAHGTGLVRHRRRDVRLKGRSASRSHSTSAQAREESTMEPRIYGPYPYLPITERKPFAWPGGAKLALWVIPNLEFFHLDDPMPGVNNERVTHAQVPNVRNWALRDYGNRVGVWRFFEVLARHGIRATAALNSDICD